MTQGPVGGHRSPFTPPRRLPALEAFRVVTPRPDRCRDPGLFLMAVCQGFHFSPLRAPCLDSPSVRTETEGGREGQSGELGATRPECRAGPSSDVALSAPLTPFFTFSVHFLPSGLSLDLTDSVIPSQAWILGSGAPRVAVSGPAVHLVATVHLLTCTSLWAVCCVRAGPGWPTAPHQVSSSWNLAQSGFSPSPCSVCVSGLLRAHLWPLWAGCLQLGWLATGSPRPSVFSAAAGLT